MSSESFGQQRLFRKERSAYSRERFQGKVVRYIRSIIHQRNIWLEREPWSNFGDGPRSKGDVCEQEQK